MENQDLVCAKAGLMILYDLLQGDAGETAWASISDTVDTYTRRAQGLLTGCLWVTWARRSDDESHWVFSTNC